MIDIPVDVTGLESVVTIDTIAKKLPPVEARRLYGAIRTISLMIMTDASTTMRYSSSGIEPHGDGYTFIKYFDRKEEELPQLKDDPSKRRAIHNASDDAIKLNGRCALEGTGGVTSN